MGFEPTLDITSFLLHKQVGIPYRLLTPYKNKKPNLLSRIRFTYFEFLNFLAMKF